MYTVFEMSKDFRPNGRQWAIVCCLWGFASFGRDSKFPTLEYPRVAKINTYFQSEEIG